MTILLVASAALSLIALGIAVYIASGRLLEGSRGTRGAVAAAPESSPPRVRDLIEQIGNLDADMKNMQRQWGDFEKSWERRWGTLARQQRRDSAAAAADDAADEAPDPEQLSFPTVQAPTPPAERRRLVPTRMMGMR